MTLSWISIGMVALAGALVGAAIAILITVFIMNRLVRQRDDAIEDLIWQQAEFDRIIGRGQAHH